MGLRHRVRQLLERHAPRVAASIVAARARRHSHRLLKQWGLVALNHRLVGQVGLRVLSGPFRGLQLTPMTLQEHIGPVLLGTYEAELHQWLDQLLRGRYEQIIDVGAKFGYYAVGLGRHYPAAASIAFDTDPWARRATREVAIANGVSTLQIAGFADAAWFDRHLQPGALVVSDCEGFERELFPPIVTTAADSSVFAIELHETLAPGVTERLMARFAPTHDLLPIRARASTSVPAHLRDQLDGFTDAELEILANEVRADQQGWLIATPKA